jgi:hypothetical protein
MLPHRSDGSLQSPCFTRAVLCVLTTKPTPPSLLQSSAHCAIYYRFFEPCRLCEPMGYVSQSVSRSFCQSLKLLSDLCYHSLGDTRVKSRQVPDGAVVRRWFVCAGLAARREEGGLAQLIEKCRNVRRRDANIAQNR